MPLNKPARSFWLRTIAEYTNGNFVEHELHDERWDGYLQCFDNSNIAGAEGGRFKLETGHQFKSAPPS